MRAPFNRFVNFYCGPDTTTPGALRQANVPARLVPDWPFTDNEVPLSAGQNYLTTEDYLPIGPPTTQTVLQRWLYDFGKADVIALTPGGPITHQVMRVETRNWFKGGFYYRSHIAPLQDEVPSVCSMTYYDDYFIHLASVGNFFPHRIGPTTWVDGDWTLEAEFGSFDEDTCESVWRWSNTTGDEYLGSMNGVTTDHLTNPVTGAIADIQPFIP